MYHPNDPRASLAADGGKAAASGAPVASFGRFSHGPPQAVEPKASTWVIRGQNFVIALSDTLPGAVLSRAAQPDEYVVLLPDAERHMEITAGGERMAVPGASLAMVPPGDSAITLPRGGRVIRFITTASADMAALAENADAYAAPSGIVAPLGRWPEPPGGLRLRAYGLDVPPSPGRFGRIWRCTTFMINYLDARHGPRDPTQMSPHHHADFEQASLCLEGDFIHHLRWPWATNKNEWREDRHERCDAPSVAIIPPPVIHTSEAIAPGLNQLVDIFSPPRLDFSAKPGWVLNAADYPQPQGG